jgi:hypothetical protein
MDQREQDDQELGARVHRRLGAPQPRDHDRRDRRDRRDREGRLTPHTAGRPPFDLSRAG